MSRVCADRISSRPISWLERKADITEKLQAMIGNHKSVSAYALVYTASFLKSIRGDRDKVRELCLGVKDKNRVAHKSLYSQLGNVPILKGKTSFTARAFRELRDPAAILLTLAVRSHACPP